MESEIGNPIEYNPNLDPLNQDKMEEEQQQIQQEPQQPYYMDYPPPPPPQESEKFDFSNIDKSTWIIAFAVFLLGFFMGKTMQPVILRYTWVGDEGSNVPINRFDFTSLVTMN